MKKLLFLLSVITSFVFIVAYSKKRGIQPKIVSISKSKKIKKLKTGKTSEREEQILQLFKGKKELMMKQIKAHFPNITTRTLRRDMDKLQSKGLIEKNGSTKSSSYKLIS